MIESFLDMHPQALYELVTSSVAFAIAVSFLWLGFFVGWLWGWKRERDKVPEKTKQKLVEQKKRIKQQDDDLFYLADDNTHMRVLLDQYELLAEEWKAGNRETPVDNVRQIKRVK